MDIKLNKRCKINPKKNAEPLAWDETDFSKQALLDFFYLKIVQNFVSFNQQAILNRLAKLSLRTLYSL